MAAGGDLPATSAMTPLTHHHSHHYQQPQQQQPEIANNSQNNSCQQQEPFISVDINPSNAYANYDGQWSAQNGITQQHSPWCSQRLNEHSQSPKQHQSSISACSSGSNFYGYLQTTFTPSTNNYGNQTIIQKSSEHVKSSNGLATIQLNYDQHAHYQGGHYFDNDYSVPMDEYSTKETYSHLDQRYQTYHQTQPVATLDPPPPSEPTTNNLYQYQNYPTALNTQLTTSPTNRTDSNNQYSEQSNLWPSQRDYRSELVTTNHCNPTNFDWQQQQQEAQVYGVSLASQQTSNANDYYKHQPLQQQGNYLVPQSTSFEHQIRCQSIEEVKLSSTNQQVSATDSQPSIDLPLKSRPSKKVHQQQQRPKSINKILNQDHSIKMNNDAGSSSSNLHLECLNQCRICGRHYARPSTLKTHLRTHTNERPYKCSVCCKTFSQAANLTAHQRVHTGKYFQSSLLTYSSTW